MTPLHIAPAPFPPLSRGLRTDRHGCWTCRGGGAGTGSCARRWHSSSGSSSTCSGSGGRRGASSTAGRGWRWFQARSRACQQACDVTAWIQRIGPPGLAGVREEVAQGTVLRARTALFYMQQPNATPPTAAAAAAGVGPPGPPAAAGDGWHPAHSHARQHAYDCLDFTAGPLGLLLS